MRYGEDTLADVDHATLKRVVCAGEVLNPQAWDWLQHTVLGGRVPVIDHMWQTETGGPVFGNPYGLALMPIKPGAAGLPLPGIAAASSRSTARPCAPNEKGIMVITRPFPGLTPALWGEPERYARDYWERIPGVVLLGRFRVRGRGRLLLVLRPRRRDHQDRRAPARHHRSRERHRHASRRRRMRCRRHGPTRRAAK